MWCWCVKLRKFKVGKPALLHVAADATHDVHLLLGIQRAPPQHTDTFISSTGFVTSSCLIGTLDPENGRLFALA